MPKTFVFILDFTYNGNKVFALEMGDFFKSGLSGLDRLREEKKQRPLHVEYRNRLRKAYPAAIYLEDKSTKWTSEVQLYDFSNDFKAECNYKKDGLIPNLLYSRALLGTKYFFERPVIVSLQATGFPPKFRSSLTELQEQQQNTLAILNYPKGVLIDACLDKVVFHQFTDKTGFCPPTMLVNILNVNSNEINQFISTNCSSHYVIKPTNMSLGSGVKIIKSKDVIAHIQQLQEIANNSFFNMHKSPNNSNGLAVWNDIILNKGNHFLLLQACCPSKKINYKGQDYFPTGRAVIEVTFDDASTLLPALNFLGSYWEFPVKVADTISTLSLLSHVGDNNPVATIESND